MKISTAGWTTAFAAAVWLGLPAAGWAQTPPTTPAQGSAATASAPASQLAAAQEHLRQAQAALNDIPPAALTGRVKTRTTELNRHLGALAKSVASATASKTAARTKPNWATEVGAIDKILTELLGPATGASAAPVTLDDTAKTKLTAVRTQITAFAAAMSGTTASPTPEPSSPSSTSAASASAMATPVATSAQAPAAPTTSDTQAPQPASQADPEAAKRHLTAAQDALSQLTQLPAAAQLTGEPRTQVAQLITNFNALSTATSDWRSSYDKVNANLTALIGAQPTNESATPTAGVAGAVGTAGTASGSLDPAIKAKLVEFRNHLVQFEKAAGGAPSATSASKSETPAPTPTPETTAAQTTAAPPTPATTAAAVASAQERPAQQRPATAPPSETASQDSPMRHIDAIEAILSGRSATTGTPGATSTTGASTAASLTLDRAQIEQIRMHLAELRKIVDRK